MFIAMSKHFIMHKRLFIHGMHIQMFRCVTQHIVGLYFNVQSV